MKRRAVKQIIFIVTVAVFVFSSCSLLRDLGLAPPVFREDFSQLTSEEFPEKIKQLEDISQNHKKMAVRTRALYYLAIAHLHYNNPSPDYAKALEYLDGYIARDSDNKDIDEIATWKATLQILDNSLRQYKKLEEDYAQLKKEYETANKDKASLKKNEASLNKKINELDKMIASQKKEIASLQETIKKLDTVQREIERKKRAIKK
jgi:chromosome segregation ATPase